MFGDATDFILGMGVDVAGFSGDMDKANDRIDDFSDNVDHAGQKGGLLNGAFDLLGKGALVAGGGVLALGGFLAGAAKSAAEEQVGVERLNQTLANSIPNWDKNTDSVEAYISSKTKLAFADDQLRDSLGFLVGQTKDLGEAQELQSLAMDLARSKNIDLMTATKAVGKVDQDSIGILKKLGIEVTEEMSKEEALTAIRAQSAGQAEAYANTAQGSMERVQNALGDAFETIGGAVLPLIEGPLQAFADWVQSPEVTAGIQSLAEGIGTFLVQAFQFLQGAFETISPIIASVWSYLTSPDVIATVTGIATTIGDLLGGAFSLIGGIFDVVGPVIQTVWSYLTSPEVVSTVTNIATVVGTTLADAFTFVSGVVSTAWPVVQGLLEGGLTFISGLWENTWGGIQMVFEGAWGIIQGAFEIGWSIISGLWETGAALLEGDWEGAWTAIQSMFEGIWEGVQDLLQGGWTYIQGLWEIGTGFLETTWDTVWGAIGGFVTDAWNGITTTISDAFTGVQTFISTTATDIKEGWDTFWGDVGTKVGEIWDGIVTSLGEAWDTVTQFLVDAPGEIWDTLIEVGSSVIDGIVQGLKDAAGAIWDFILGVLQGLADNIINFFEPGSPSKLMAREVGEPMAWGIAQGFADAMPGAIDMITSSLASMVPALQSTIPLLPGMGVGQGIGLPGLGAPRLQLGGVFRGPGGGQLNLTIPIHVGGVLHDTEQISIDLENYRVSTSPRSRQ